jgi:hypothetical protein
MQHLDRNVISRNYPQCDLFPRADDLSESSCVIAIFAMKR